MVVKRSTLNGPHVVDEIWIAETGPVSTQISGGLLEQDQLLTVFLAGQLVTLPRRIYGDPCVRDQGGASTISSYACACAYARGLP